MLATSSLSPVAVYVIGTIVGGFGLGLLGWVASSLLKHAQIIAVVTLAIPQIQSDVRSSSAAIGDLRVSVAEQQVRLDSALAHIQSMAPSIIASHTP